VICGTAEGYVICGASGGTLFLKCAEVVGGSFLHNGRTDNKPEVELD
jgi:hypothetical protein